MELFTNHKPIASMASYKILFLFLFVSFLNFATTDAQDQSSTPVYLYHYCYGRNTTANSAFQINVGNLLSSLSSNYPGDNGFYNTTVPALNPSDSVFGLFMCRGDVPPQLCQHCVQSATQQLSSLCSLSIEAVIWYEECTVRYSNRSFFSTVDTTLAYALLNTANVSNQESFMSLLFSTINKTADEAAKDDKKFATSQTSISEFQSLYCLAQCTPDLSPLDCRSCLSQVIGDLPWCCEGKPGGRVLCPSCNVRYELYPFYRSTNYPDADSQFPEDPTYLNHNSHRAKMLSWFERYNIIGGIARGIYYLHELSRLKIIHRDLKPSNILLDENMIPKISDFGLARSVEINQDQGNTKRIVGTYGYMSPEYAMLGQFSEKSDVFSFGVMVLEIISGKKNSGLYEPHRVADGLLSCVWRQWRDQKPLSILDASINENYSEIEVIKCIQIGLLCVQQNPDDRPTMVAILSYLSSHLIELPRPQEPALFLHGRKDPKAFAQESSSSHNINASTLFSINEMSISQFLPR
ncbi:Cysteine-rich receptor-like protein kinase 5 [Glycine soja]|nr:Cysteine-rich receptor-like protein kinase 5 [Glycine soja]